MCSMKDERVIRVPTTGVSDFESIVTDDTKKYVDKTDLLYELARDKTDAQLLISRPRRFGKSLMLSTLKAMFQGRRDLFRGLAIDRLPWEGWEKPTPVYSFTMSTVVGETYEFFMEQLAKLVKRLCAQAGVPYVGAPQAWYGLKRIVPIISCVPWQTGRRMRRSSR